MNNFATSGSLNAPTDLSEPVEGDGVLDLEGVLGIIRRHWAVVVIFGLIAMVLGGIYAATAVPLYTATSSLMIERGNNKGTDLITVLGSGSDDENSVLSQVQVLQSDTIGYAVVDKLKLIENSEFMASSQSIVGAVGDYVIGLLKSEEDEAVSTSRLRNIAVSRVLSNMEVERVGQTYVLTISYTATSRGLAANIANGIAEAYLTDTLDSKYEATRRASTWLQERIAELQQKALDSDLAVERFRATNGLLSAGNVLVADQNLSQINSALVAAQADAAKANARYEQMQKIIKSGDTNAVVREVLDSPTANNLREQYLTASKNEAEISSRLGAKHEQAVRYRRDMEQYRRLLFEELGRIAESYRSDANVAAEREKSLLLSVNAASGQTANANDKQVELRELQREADTYRGLYQTFLQRYQGAVQQQSFPVTEARVISKAIPPVGATSPSRPLSLIAGLFLGCLAGVGVAGIREFQERFYRTGDQIREDLGVEFLGVVPMLNEDRLAPLSVEQAQVARKFIRENSTISRHVLDNPLSSFTETLRSAKIAVDFSHVTRSCRTVGIVSSLPGEGKSTIAVNFAQLLANQGARTVLIDADLRNLGATRALATHARAGIVEVILGAVKLDDALMSNPSTKLSFLPAILKRQVPYSSELLTTPAMRRLLNELSATHDYIVIDLPPAGAVVDARALASLIDSFVYVVEWGQTARRVVQNIFDSETEISTKCAGVLLNKVDQKKMKLYSVHGGTEYYSSRYSSYYRDGI